MRFKPNKVYKGGIAFCIWCERQALTKYFRIHMGTPIKYCNDCMQEIKNINKHLKGWRPYQKLKWTKAKDYENYYKPETFKDKWQKWRREH